jgi:phosphatidylethanolamine N-methyltransferase
MTAHSNYIGYAWIYGISLIVGSYPVLFVSLAAHSAQFAFLVFFENPREFYRLPALPISHPLALDIERFYGQRKLLAERVPILQPSRLVNGPADVVPSQRKVSILARARAFSDPHSTTSTPGASTPFESETETDTELDSQQAYVGEGTGITKLSGHDLHNQYFRRDTIVLFHFDVFRYASLARGRNLNVTMLS